MAHILACRRARREEGGWTTWGLRGARQREAQARQPRSAQLWNVLQRAEGCRGIWPVCNRLVATSWRGEAGTGQAGAGSLQSRPVQTGELVPTEATVTRPCSQKTLAHGKWKPALRRKRKTVAANAPMRQTVGSRSISSSRPSRRASHIIISRFWAALTTRLRGAARTAPEKERGRLKGQARNSTAPAIVELPAEHRVNCVPSPAAAERLRGAARAMAARPALLPTAGWARCTATLLPTAAAIVAKSR